MINHLKNFKVFFCYISSPFLIIISVLEFELNCCDRNSKKYSSRLYTMNFLSKYEKKIYPFPLSPSLPPPFLPLSLFGPTVCSCWDLFSLLILGSIHVGFELRLSSLHIKAFIHQDSLPDLHFVCCSWKVVFDKISLVSVVAYEPRFLPSLFFAT